MPDPSKQILIGEDQQNRMALLVRRYASLSSDPLHEKEQISAEVIRAVADALIRLRRENPRFKGSEWSWLFSSPSGNMTRKSANKFLCACFLDFRSGKADIWDNTIYFIEDILEDPENIWQVIHNHTREEWKERFFEYNLHPEITVHERLWKIASGMIRFYAGDGRQIWTGFENSPDEVYKRLNVLQIPRSISCLIIGALKDEGCVTGPFDIVGDIVDARVIGRMLCGVGSDITPFKARKLARMVAPEDSWVLDRPLYLIGSAWCGPGPKCRACPVHYSCFYAISQDLNIKPEPDISNLLLGIRTVQKTLRHWQD